MTTSASLNRVYQTATSTPLPDEGDAVASQAFLQQYNEWERDIRLIRTQMSDSAKPLDEACLRKYSDIQAIMSRLQPAVLNLKIATDPRKQKLWAYVQREGLKLTKDEVSVIVDEIERGAFGIGYHKRAHPFPRTIEVTESEVYIHLNAHEDKPWGYRSSENKLCRTIPYKQVTQGEQNSPDLIRRTRPVQIKKNVLVSRASSVPKIFNIRDTEHLILQRLVHIPGVLKFHHTARFPGKNGLEKREILFPVCEGGDLHVAVYVNRTPINIIQVSEQLLETVAKMHEARIVHRDIHLANLLLTGDDTLQLCDFTKALDVGTTKTYRPLSQEDKEARYWLDRYAYPESGEVTKPVGFDYDVYAVGATLKKLFPRNGVNPFKPLFDSMTGPLEDRPTAEKARMQFANLKAVNSDFVSEYSKKRAVLITTNPSPDASN